MSINNDRYDVVFSTIENIAKLNQKVEHSEQTQFEESPAYANLNLQSRMQQWFDRQKFYIEMEKNGDDFKKYAAFNKWQNSTKLSIQEQKLMRALIALQQLYEQYDTTPQALKTERLILQVIDIELGKMEVAQSRKLQKIQNLDRVGLNQAAIELYIKRKKSSDDIEAEKLSRQFDETNSKDLKDFFSHHEGKIHFTRHLIRADKASDVGSAASAATSIFTSASSMAPALAQAASAVGGALIAIPVVGAIANAIPIILNAAKAWVQNKSTAKKVGAVIAIGLTVAGLVAAGVAIGITAAAVATAGIGAGLAIFGSIYGQVIPLIATLAKIRNMNNEISRLKEHENELSSTTPITSLNLQDKEFLLQKMEETWVNMQLKREENFKDLEAAKSLVLAENDITKLNENRLVKQMLSAEKSAGRSGSLNDFLKHQTENKIAFLTAQKEAAKDNAKATGWALANAAISITGAILLCIPTPPTLLAGAILLGISAAIGIAQKYNVGTKILNFFGNLFGEKKEKQTKTPEAETTTKPKNDLQFDNTLTAVSNTHTATPEPAHEYTLKESSTAHLAKIGLPIPAKSGETKWEPASVEQKKEEIKAAMKRKPINTTEDVANDPIIPPPENKPGRGHS